MTLFRRVDPPCAQELDCAPNEGGRSIPLAIMEKLEETLTKVKEMVERDQYREADASMGAKSCEGKPVQMQMISTATEDTLPRMNNTISDSETRVTTQKLLMSPIHRLPPELLCTIFQRCLRKKIDIANMLTTLSLASVCQYWRAVTCSFGVLWCCIAFSAKHTKLLEVFMERSCHYIDLSVCEDSLDWASHRLIPPNRVRQLCVVLKYHDDDKDVLSSWSVVLPNLSCFRIETDNWDYVRTISGDFLSLFPNLEELKVFEINLHFSKHFQLMKLQRIIWLVQGHPQVQRCLLGNICPHAPYLNSFVFCGPERSSPSRLTNMAFGPLPELTAMKIDFFDLEILKPLADPLIVPSLQHLTFRWIPLSCPRDEKHLNDVFLHYASIASLTRLSLVLDSLWGYSKLQKTKHELDCLIHLIHLTLLNIMGVEEAEYDEGHPSVTYLCHLLSVCTPKPSFPCLRTIRFIGKIKLGVSLDAVIQMARARTAAAVSSPNDIAKLESIAFEDCEPLTVEQYRELWDALGSK